MTRQKMDDPIVQKKSHSKAFKEGLGILVEEIELALHWHRPSILLAVHNSSTGRIETQQTLEREIIKKGRQVKHLRVESASPDVIRIMSETPKSENMVFFVSGLENADRTSDGKVYRALNIRRELIVERQICVVFWLNESEAANLPRLAPDFWAFRHRAVEFAPKHGTIKQILPAGLFLWEENIPWQEEAIQKNELSYYEKFLMRIPKEDSSAVAQIETILKLTHYSWLVNDLKKFKNYVEGGLALLKKYPIPRYQAWMLNATGIGVYEEGNKKDANIFFNQALSHHPENSAIIMNSGITAHGLGKNGEAILAGRQAIKIDSRNIQLWRVLGYLYLSMGKVEDAIQVMRKGLELDPKNMDIHYALAVCYYKNEQPAECAKEISIAENKFPPHNAIQRAWVGILRGRLNDSLAQLKRSIEKREVSQHHIQRDPNLHFLMNLGEYSVTD